MANDTPIATTAVTAGGVAILNTTFIYFFALHLRCAGVKRPQKLLILQPCTNLAWCCHFPKQNEHLEGMATSHSTTCGRQIVLSIHHQKNWSPFSIILFALTSLFWLLALILYLGTPMHTSPANPRISAILHTVYVQLQKNLMEVMSGYTYSDASLYHTRKYLPS